MTEHKGADRHKILIIDDSETNVQVLSEILRPFYHTYFALSGKEGIDLALILRPDLIILDVMMPKMDGYEVCRRLKTLDELKHIPVIFVTAVNSEEDETRGLELGAIDYITKPISPAIVRARVKNHLDLKRYRDLLEKMAFIDGLTGVPNRRHFDDLLEQEWKRGVRTGEPISIILADIDFFKQYNDNYGHLEGDQCLRSVAKALASAIKRPGDLLARFGGEEFACILPSTGQEGAVKIADDLRKAVLDLHIPHEYSMAANRVTLSLGVATIFPTPETSAETLIKMADDMLYKAKDSGRNRIISA